MSGYVDKLVKQARQSSYEIINLTSGQKNVALKAMAKAVKDNYGFILEENKKDVARAVKRSLSKSFIDRLALNEKRLQEMSVSLKEVADLPDPVNQVIARWSRPNGLQVRKVRVPIGVVLIIYEARPNVTADCIGLLFKTSNIGILRGGGDAVYSNKAIGRILGDVLERKGINYPVFFVVENRNRRIVDELLKQNNYIDLVIPRGGESLIRKVVENSHIPVIKHYKGVCHIFIDKDADYKKALRICVNAKVQRPSVCNAVETILVHKDIAGNFLPLLKKEFDKYNVRIRGDEATRAVIPAVQKATGQDWVTEYLDLIVSIKVVSAVEEAIKHINLYGSHHTESILTRNAKNARKFVREVDSACCFVNISTRFSDGYQLGLGAEIGISTDKLHARGPMGLEELTTYKWVVSGNGQVRE